MQAIIGAALVSVLALALRVSLIDGQNLDLEGAQRWLNFIRDHGGFDALKVDFSNYTPFYSYVLLLGSYLPDSVDDAYILKGASIVADFVCAYFAARIVWRARGDALLAVSAFAVLLFAPTVVLNSAHWGQTDMIFTAGVVACLAFLLERRELVAMIAFGFAFAVKLQALVFAPFLLVLALKRAMPWRYFLVVPAVYMVWTIPTLVAGRSLTSLLTIYGEQAGDKNELTLNAANAWQWIPLAQSEVLDRPALVWGTSVVLLLTLLVGALPFELTRERILALATASVLVTPFVMPRMHDRFFFAADVLSIILAFCVPRLFLVPLLVQLASLFSYEPFLFNSEPVPLKYAAFANLAAITLLFVWIGRELASDLRRSSAAPTAG